MYCNPEVPVRLDASIAILTLVAVGHWEMRIAAIDADTKVLEEMFKARLSILAEITEIEIATFEEVMRLADTMTCMLTASVMLTNSMADPTGTDTLLDVSSKRKSDTRCIPMH